MKKMFSLVAAAAMAVLGVQAQYTTIGQTTTPGVGIGLPLGPNFSDAALHIKAAANSYYSSGNGESLLFCETSNAPGDYFRLVNGKGSVGGTFAPFLYGYNSTDATATAMNLGANISTANDVLNTSPLLMFSVRKGFTPRSSLETSGAGAAVANRPLFQWNNNTLALMTITPTTTAFGNAKLGFGMTNPVFKMDITTPGSNTNDGLRITNTGNYSAMLRLRAASAGGHDWSLQSSGLSNGPGPGHLFFYDNTTSLYRLFINGTTGNVGIGNTNSVTTAPQARLDVNTSGPNDGIRVLQTGTTAASLQLTGGGPQGILAGQARRWVLFSTGTGNVQGAGHLQFWDWTNNKERMRIHENGFVGINTAVASITSPPSHLFHVKSNTVNGANVDPVRIETLNAATDNDVVTVDAAGVLHTRSITSLPSAGITSSCVSPNVVPVVNSSLGDLRCGSIYDNGNVGIGTTSPLHKVHIDNGALMLSGAVAGFGGPQLLFSDNLTSHPNGRWAIEYTSAPPVGGLNFWAPSPGGTAGNYNIFIRNDGKVGMGVTDESSDPNYSATAFAGNYKLYVKGGILTDKVKVAVYNTTNWADYVFAPEYKLKSLDEVEAFTKANKHLPGVQSASELVKDGGIDVSQMFAKQMEKIEELTLYMIEMKKEIKALKTENAELKSSIVSPSKN